MKKAVFLSSVLAVLAASAELTVSNVKVSARDPWQAHTVKVTFEVAGVTTETNAKFAFSAYDGETKLCDIDAAKVRGDIYADVDGTCEVEIDTADLHPMTTSRGALKDFRIGVEASETSPILYKLINLENNPGDAHHIVYLTRDDIVNGSHPGIPGNFGVGYEVNPVNGVDSFIWTGVTNITVTNKRYVNGRIVFRRIPAGSFKMGTSQKDVTISKGFWMGVFPLTWGQYGQLTPDETEKSLLRGLTTPATTFSNTGKTWSRTLTWNDMRGADCVWPECGHRVDPASVCGWLAARAGEDGFDLPTEAQWEYACRAGTTGNLYRSEELSAIGCYSGNGGSMDRPGNFLPNAWGLYDMIGFVWERVLDWNSGIAGGVDPWGIPSGSFTQRVIRGGSSASGAGNCTCTARTADANTAPDGGGNIYGFRLVQNGRW